MHPRTPYSILVGGLCLAIACLGSPAAFGELTHYVPFDAGYTAGGDLHGMGGSDLGFGTNTWFDTNNNNGNDTDDATVGVGNLSAPAGLPVAGGHAINPSPFGLNFYTMDTDGDGANGEPEDALQAGVHWLSFVARAETDANFGGLSLVKFFGPEVLYIGKVGGAGGTEWGVDSGGNAQAAGGDITMDTFLVAKLTLGAGANDDTVDLYINPPLGSMAPAMSDLTAAFNEDPANNRALDEIRLGGEAGEFAADEIRIGTTYADVALPEPGTGILMLGLAALGLRRRRQVVP